MTNARTEFSDFKDNLLRRFGPSAVDVVIKYLDPEGDLCTVASNLEFQEALRLVEESESTEVLFQAQPLFALPSVSAEQPAPAPGSVPCETEQRLSVRLAPAPACSSSWFAHSAFVRSLARTCVPGSL